MIILLFIIRTRILSKASKLNPGVWT